MKLTSYIACVCEGSAEAAIIDILIDNDLLIFSRENMIEEGVIRCRNGKTFAERYLRKGFKNQVSIIRILDSRREVFRLGKAYERFKRSGKKPSEFCKVDLRMYNVKAYDFVRDYFREPQTLVHSILEYSRMSNVPKGEYSLADLLK